MKRTYPFLPSRRAPKFHPCSPTILPYFQPFLIPWTDILILDFKVVKTSFAISNYLTRIAQLKTAILLQKHWFMAFLLRMSRKTQHTRFEDKILRKFANEDKLQVVQPCLKYYAKYTAPFSFSYLRILKVKLLWLLQVGIALLEDAILISNTNQNNHLECKCIGNIFQRAYWT